MSQVCRRAMDWLCGSVIEHHDADRPFRLRRMSALLLSLGWVLFLVSCLIGYYAVQNGLPVYNSFDAATGATWKFGVPSVRIEPDALVAFMQWQLAVTITGVLGATLFFAGLISVHAFDRLDEERVPLRRGL